MSKSLDISTLFEAFWDAHSAYVRLSSKGRGRSDQELAGDPDYQAFLRSGMRLARIGGEAAIKGAIDFLSRLHGTNQKTAQLELERLWAGMDSWKAGFPAAISRSARASLPN